MKVKATVSICGKICMAKGEIRDITDKEICKDLIRCGYVKEVKSLSDESAEEEKNDETKSAHSADSKKIPWEDK